ncbi:Clp protease-like protein [Myxococcus phage Mx1]|nr:Clp protease-like protein [Myxococcus phage Mx1]
MILMLRHSMETRTLVLCDEITSESTKDFLQAFLALDASRGPIEVRICSGGGWTGGGFAIYDAIRHAKNTVTTVGTGLVGSMATLIFQAGDKRVLMKNTAVFLHPISMGGEGYLSVLETHLQEAKRLQEQYIQEMSARTGRTVHEIKKLCSKDVFFDADEAITYGLADEIAKRKQHPRPRPKKQKTKK